jgi:glycosyltransferase involved in cell wall biosynthesis
VLALLPADNAVADTIAAAEAGLVVAPGDPDAAIEALLSLLDSPVKRAAMGTAARRYAEVTFDVSRVGDRFESLLHEISSGEISLPNMEKEQVTMATEHSDGSRRAEHV